MPSTLSATALTHHSSHYSNTHPTITTTNIHQYPQRQQQPHPQHHQQQHHQQQHRTSFMDHDRDQDPLYPVNLQGGATANATNNGHSNSNGNGYNGHNPVPSASLLYHQPAQHHHQPQELSQGLLSPVQQQQTPQQQHFNAQQHHIYSSQHNNHGGDYHGYHPDLQKPISHPLDIYQTPAQPQDQALLTPLINRQLSGHANSFQAPHHPQHPYQHHHHSQQQQQQQYYQTPHYHYQQQQHLKPYSDPHSDPTAPPTPASTATSTMTTGSSSSTPSLPPSTSALPYQSGDYPHLGLPLTIPTWTTATNASPSEQDMQPRQSQPPQQQPQPQPPHPQHPSYPQPARDLAQLGSLKATGDRASYYQSPPPPPGQIPAHLYSQQSHDPHHHQQQQQPQQEQQQAQQTQQQQNTPAWVGNMPSDSFHSSPDFLDHPDRQQQKQTRLFSAADNCAAHTPHDAVYASGGGYFDGHGVPTNDRARGQASRQPQLGRGLMEYSDSSYHGQHGQDSSSLASQHQQQTGGMAGASMDGLPLMSPSHPSLPFSLLNSGNAVAKSLSASLDSVPMGLGPPGMMSHPNYGSVASYMSASPTPMGGKGGAINTAVVPGGGLAGSVTRPTPPPGPHRSQSARATATGGQGKSLKKRRTRTSSMTSSSSIASSGIMSSITSTLGATNISFTEPPPQPGMHQHHQHQQHHHHSNHNSHNHHYSSSLPNLSMPSVLSGAEFSDESSHNNSGGGGLHGLAIATGSNPIAGGASSTTSSPTSGKPRPGGHPRSAVAARVFECSFPGCNKAYTQLHNLKSHERTGHTPVQKPRPFLCIIPGCTKAFSQRKSLALHIRASHKEYKFKPFKCSQQGCDKSYTQLHNLRTHEKTVHMLDLSRKRIRNPVPYSEDGGSGSGGMKIEGNGGSGASSMMTTGLPGSSSSLARGDHFSGDVGMSYEIIDDLKDFSAADRMPGNGEEYDRRRGPIGVAGSIGEDDEEDEEGLAGLKEEGDDEEDGDYVEE